VSGAQDRLRATNSIKRAVCHQGGRRLARHEPESRRTYLRSHHRIDDAGVVAPVLGAVGVIDGIVDVAIGLREANVSLDSAGADVAFVALLDPLVPPRGPYAERT
jgi:hypothetical protein